MVQRKKSAFAPKRISRRVSSVRVEAAKSHDEYRAVINADAAKTMRLRALRLAKEAADELAAKARAAEKLALAALPKVARKKPVRKTSLVAAS